MRFSLRRNGFGCWGDVSSMGSSALYPSRALGVKCQQPQLLWALRKVVPLGLAWSSQGPSQLAKEDHTDLSLAG